MCVEDHRQFYRINIITQMNTKVNTYTHYFTSQMNDTIEDREEGAVMDTKQRIRALMDERQWSEYRLAIASGLSQSTVANIFNRNTTPSVSTLEAICRGFGITMAQFFAQGDMVELTQEQQQMFRDWSTLTQMQKEALQHLIKVMKAEK